MQCPGCGQENSQDACVCSRCNTPLPVTPVPVPEIGVGASYNHGWKQLWKHFWMLLLMTIIVFAISMVASLFTQGFAVLGGMTGMGLGEVGATIAITVLIGVFIIAYIIFLTNPLNYGINYAYLKAVRDDQIEVKDMFESFRCYWEAVLAGLLTGLIVFAGIILLIVPGIVFSCKLAFVPFLVVDRKMGAIDSIKESWRMTGGYAWKVFLIGLLGLPITIAGYICLIIGVIPATMWISTAYASLYYSVSSSGQAFIQPEMSTSV
jgi:uncharacterized membrane protein